jgi:hypothetical protein
VSPYARRAVVVATTRHIYFGRAVGDDVAGELELLDARILDDVDLMKIVSLAMIGPSPGARVGERIDRLVVRGVIEIVDASPRATEAWLSIPSSEPKGCATLGGAAMFWSIVAIVLIAVVHGYLFPTY